MEKIVVCLCLIALLFATCKKENEDAADYSLLAGKSYAFTVDKILRMPDVRFPGDGLQELEYSPSNEIIQYIVAISENGQHITIEPGSIIGKSVNDNETTLRYELDEGLFAGGRFVIWYDADFLNAEFTIYGSGVPIIKSERGTMEQLGW